MSSFFSNFAKVHKKHDFSISIFRMNRPKLKTLAINISRIILTPIYREGAFFIFTFLCLSFPAIVSVIKYFGDITMTRGIITAICGNMVLSYIGAALICVCPYSWQRTTIKTLLYATTLLLTYLAAALRFKFGRFITPSELAILLDTNQDETAHFFQTYLTSGIVIVSVLAITAAVTIALLLERRQAKTSQILPFNTSIICILSVCLLYGAYDMSHILRICTFRNIEQLEKWTSTDYWRIDDRHGDPVSKLLYSATSTRLSKKKVSEWREYNNAAFSADNITHAANDLKIVMVLGESFIKWHSPLYGYERDTTPYMAAEQSKGNLIAYNDVVCTKNSTIEMVRNILCTNNPAQNESWHTTPYFPLLFASAGWKVYYWDNQTHLKGDNWIYNFTMTDFLFDNYLKQHCYTSHYKDIYAYDGESVDDYARNVSIGDGNELSIFHLIGQHFNASTRYPHTKEFCLFADTDTEDSQRPWLNEAKRRDIAEYDNATLYNDFVINKLFDMYRDRNAVIIYFSDHGEEIYDYRDSQGRAANESDLRNYLKYQYCVPFFVWMSDSFIANNGETASRLRKAADTPFLSDNVSHLIMGIASMDSPYYRERYDPSSPTYSPDARIVTENSLNYDEIMN